MRYLPRYHRTVSAAHHHIIGLVFASMFVLGSVAAGPASAIERIHLDQDVIRAEPGSAHQLAFVDVEASHVGLTCTMRVLAANQESIHPNNDLLITTGDSRAVIPDVESEAAITRDLSAEVVLGETVLVQMRLGRHGVASMGFDLDVDCGTGVPVLEEQDPCGTAEGGSEGASVTGGTEGTEGTQGSEGAQGSEGTEGTQAAGCDEDEDDDESVAEVVVPPPSVPEPCEDGSDPIDAGAEGSFTVDENGCPEPETDPSPTPTTAPPTTEPPATTAPSGESGTAGAGAAGSTSTTTSGSSPTVLGAQQLPGAAPAVPVQASPSYAG